MNTMSTTDEAATARLDLRKSNTVRMDDGHAQLVATQALVHATLALVEEQRTANLIAFGSACARSMVDDGGAFRRAAENLGLTEGGELS